MFFIDKNFKLYVTVNGTLIIVDKRFPILLQWAKDNWNDIAQQYAELNKDSKYIGKKVKIYLTDESFAKLQKELKYYKSSYFSLGLSSNEIIVQLCNNEQRKDDERMDNLPKMSMKELTIAASMLSSF